MKEAGERMPQIRDAILLLMSNKTFSEMSDLQGKLQLRAELLSRINSFFRKGKVQKIYFTEFVVQ
jgi:flagellar FliL protein